MQTTEDTTLGNLGAWLASRDFRLSLASMRRHDGSTRYTARLTDRDAHLASEGEADSLLSAVVAAIRNVQDDAASRLAGYVDDMGYPAEIPAKHG